MGARGMVRVGACLLALLVLAGCDWLQSGYGAGHASYNPETDLTPANVSGLTQKFTISTAGRNYMEPIVVDNILYATSFESATGTARLEAFDTMTGNPGFSTTLATGTTSVTPPVAANGTVYAAINGSAPAPSLYAVSASSGAIVWSLPLTGSVVSSLTIHNGIVMVALTGNSNVLTQVIGVDATTGAVKWTWAPDQLSLGGAAIAVASQGLVAISYAVHAQTSGPFPATTVIDESDGATLWETNPNALTSDGLATSANGLLYGTVTDPATLYAETGAVDPATGSIVWENTQDPVTGPPAVSGRSAIYLSVISASETGLTALDPHAGTKQWTSPPVTGVTGRSGPVISSGVVFFVTSDSTTATLHAYDAATGSQAAAITLPTSSTPRPIVANGQVYLADGTSITAFGLA